MPNRAAHTEGLGGPAANYATGLGFWAALLVAAAGGAALGIAVATAPARSGPFCLQDVIGSCVDHPYTDVAGFVPIEYVRMYPALLMAVVQPSLLKGELESLSLFSQYNPHGIFIVLEDAGYLMMGAALLFVAALGGRGQLERAIRIAFVASGVLAVGSRIVLALWYGVDLAYRYEVAAILTDWLTLIVSGALLSVCFWRARPKLVRCEVG